MKKRIILVAVLSIFVFSCSKYSDQLEVVEKHIQKNLSEIERRNINYNCVEMSDREALEEIISFDRIKLETANKNLDEYQKKYDLGKFRTRSFDNMSAAELKNYVRIYEFGKSYSNQVKICTNHYSNHLKEFSKLKGLNPYYKVEVLKVDPDTIIHRKVYLNDKNKIIYTKAYK
ncbi:hypothetical protein IRZ71_24340 [Flavobacterium sp. ANB]|uniref:hypothetical protein n=1 Tax=unclassified Flavobacterium TaxID=196869 RepID=UPI0012B72E30|nr:MULTISPECIES: hypothetical protein [unclassified Flavobacterium]MBF4519486.1 hypothetical protein [Flavobacterium sp. ANB]MTD72503.1 hypothetical protein [Flavobacterium sp. LC2016-13]